MARHSSPGQRPAAPLPRPALRLPALPLPALPLTALPTLGVPALAGGPGAGALTAAFVPVGTSSSSGALPGRFAPTRPPLPPGGPAPRRPVSRPRPPAGPGAALRGRLTVAAVAVGALATAGHGLAGGLGDGGPVTLTDALALRSLSAPDTGTDTGTGTGPTATRPTATRPTAPTGTSPRTAGAGAAVSGVLPVTTTAPRTGAPTTTPAATAATAAVAAGEVGSLSKSRRLADAAAGRAAAAAVPDHVRPAEGRFTSGFGARWGTSHQGIDIANRIGTSIVSVADGTVIEAGPASGFGQWVRIRLDDGTITVYGHVHRFFVTEGQRVRAGEEIAEIGNEGHSTGPHLHFEVWTPAGKKINPVPWFAGHGVSLGGGGEAAPD